MSEVPRDLFIVLRLQNQCLISNFPTRTRCYKCGTPRPGPYTITIPLAILFPALTIQADMDATGPPGVSAPKIANDGDNDVAPENQPSQFLLIRGLEASVTEELLAKGVSKLYRPSGNNDSAPENQKKGSKVASTTGDSNLGAREGSLRRVLLVRDRRTNESWRFGFAEFAGINVRLFYSSLILFSFLTLDISGCTSCNDAAQVFRKVYHLLQAGVGHLHSWRSVCSSYERSIRC